MAVDRFLCLSHGQVLRSQLVNSHGDPRHKLPQDCSVTCYWSGVIFSPEQVGFTCKSPKYSARSLALNFRPAGAGKLT